MESSMKVYLVQEESTKNYKVYPTTKTIELNKVISIGSGKHKIIQVLTETMQGYKIAGITY